MKKIVLLFTCMFLTFSFQSVYANKTPIGFWKTIDDVTGKPKAIVEIRENAAKKIYGRIVKVFPRPGLAANPVCSACTGKRKNQPLVGLVILEGLSVSKDNQREWSGGKILDPKTGKIYHSTIKLQDSGSALLVRGFVGLPLFGRSQHWVKIDKPLIPPNLDA